MKEGLRLKIGKHWCALAPDTSISIEMTSPLWNDSGSFSYTFRVPYAENRHIFNAAEMPESDVNLKSFRQRFELYVDGIGLLFGDAVCSSDEIDEEEDSVDIELRSGNATFEDAIEGKTLRDLDLGTDALMGSYTKTERTFTPEYVKYKDFGNLDRVYYPFRGHAGGIMLPEINQTNVYPFHPFINIPVTVMGMYEKGVKCPLVLSPRRTFSSPCFFLLFVLEKVAAFADFGITKNDLNSIEDFNHIIFVNTFCKYKIQSTSQEDNGTHVFEPFGTDKKYTFTYTGMKQVGKAYFTSENLPDISISDFINSLKNAFGVRIIGSDNGTISIVLLKNVFRSTKVNSINAKDIYSIRKKNITTSNLKVCYNNSEGDEFDFSDYENVRAYNDYESLLLEWNSIKSGENGEDDLSKDITLKIMKDTGNFLRTKVDKEKFDGPELFEVAQFLPYISEGDGVDKTETELSIGFNPIIPTPTTNARKVYDSIKTPSAALFANVEIDSTMGNSSFLESKTSYTLNPEVLKNLIEYDCGFMLGIVRSTPDGALSSGYTIVKTNADGFGNDQWVKSTSTSAITSDSLDMNGSIYDYNGTDEGLGIPPEDLISLKIWNNKQNLDPTNLVGEDENGNVITGSDVFNNNPTGTLPNRGLVPQFLMEYLHFVKNRKPLTIEIEIEVAELSNIKWEEYYNLSGYRFLLDKITFNVSNDGIGVVTMDVYCI